jgi:hypothetical protein
MEDQIGNDEKVDLALIRAEHQKKFQVMIDFVKERVGNGIEYKNSIVRIVVSEVGAFCELSDLPEEFTGVVSEHVERRFVAPSEAIDVLERTVQAVQETAPDGTRKCSILALYTRRGLVDRKNCFVLDIRRDDDEEQRPATRIGALQPGVMPLFYKIRADADWAPRVLGFSGGLVLCMANTGDRNLLVRVPYEGDQVVNLADAQASINIQ